MQIQAISYQCMINVLVWSIVKDQYPVEHKHILNFVLNIKDSLIFHWNYDFEHDIYQVCNTSQIQ